MVESVPVTYKIIGAGCSIGQPRKGTEQSAEILQKANIEQFIKPEKTHWVEIIKEDPYTPDTVRSTPIKNMSDIAKFNRRLYESIVNNIKPEDFLLTVGGDHTIGSPSMTGMLKVHDSNVGVIWLDAHGDFNTPETTPSGNFHGMPVADACGLIQEESLYWGQPRLSVSQVAQIGIRDLDLLEKELMDRSGLFYFTMQQVHELGIEHCIKAALQHVDPDGTRMIHLSVDVDGLAPELFPGTGTPVPDGLTFAHYTTIMEHIKSTNRFRSMDIAELNFTIEHPITLESTKELLRLTFA